MPGAAAGMGAMSLYRYVSGRERLEGLVVGLVLSGVDLTHRHASPGALWFAESVLAILTEAGFTGRPRVMAALPPEDFPYLAETARTARGVRTDEEFRGGLEVLLRGLRADGCRSPRIG